MPDSSVAIGGGGGGGVLGLGPAQNSFGTATTADRAAAKVLLDAYATANADWLTLYNNNSSFWIRLKWDDGTVEQRRNVAGTAWEDVTNVIRGRAGVAGPAPTDSQVDARLVAAGALLSANNLGDLADVAASLTALGGLTELEVDGRAETRYTPAEKTKLTGIAASAEVNRTDAQLLTLLGLTQAELTGLLISATISGGNLVITHNDGTTSELTLTDSADGVVTAATLANNILTLERSVGLPVKVDLNALASGGPIVVRDHTRRAAISLDTTLTEAEILAGTTSTVEAIMLPTWTVARQYVCMGVPDEETDITGIFAGPFDVFAAFVRIALVIDVSGTNYKFWRTINTQSDVASGAAYRIVQA